MSDETGITRREFGKLVGAAALGSALPSMSAAMPDENGVMGAQSNELCYLSAVELASRIRRKDVSAREVLTAHLAQIERVNPRVNAIVTLVPDRAMADAAKADEALARGDRVGVLTGCRLPTRTWWTRPASVPRGAPPSIEIMSRRPDATIVTRIRGAGAITIGKDEHAGVRRGIADLQHQSLAQRRTRTT
jgi:hypothetical protein